MARTKRFHVVIATDGSVAAKAAVATAVRFPWPDSARASAVVANQVPADSRRSILLKALNQSSEFVGKDTARVLARRWPEAEVRVVDGSAVEGIVREAARRRADVIVMGGRGHGALRRLLTGSVSRGVVRQSHCSVFVVKGARRQVRHVVIGFDGSAYSRRAVELIASLKAPRGGRASLFTAVDSMPMPSQALVPRGTRAAVAAEVRRIKQERRANAQQALDVAAGTLTRAGWKVDRIVKTGVPLRDLLATVAKRRPDVAVVGARGVTGVRHLLLGSVAEGVLDHCPVPVLIVR